MRIVYAIHILIITIILKRTEDEERKYEERVKKGQTIYKYVLQHFEPCHFLSARCVHALY